MGDPKRIVHYLESVHTVHERKDLRHIDEAKHEPVPTLDHAFKLLDRKSLSQL